jgi:hypothetical protein
VNNPNYQEVVDEFREDIAGFLDKYIDEDTVTPEMMYVTIIPKNILG